MARKMTSSEINYILRGYAVASRELENYYNSDGTHYLTETVEYLYGLIPFVEDNTKIMDLFHKARELEDDAKDLDEKVCQLLNDLKAEIKSQSGDYEKLLEQEDSLRRQDDERADT